MSGPFLRKYGVQTTIPFVLYEVDGVDFRVDAADGGTDCAITKDEGAETTCTNDFVDEGTGYSIVLTATEMEAARITLYIIDSATKVWLDTAVVIDTYGHASAMHAVDLSDAVRAGLTALPNAAADAAGGLPVSDAGGLDLDAQIGTDIDTLLTRLSATRATYLDYLFSIYFGLVSAVAQAQAGAAGSITLAAAASAIDDFYKGMTVVLYTGTGAGQARSITAYNGTTKVATVDPNWATAPDATSWYVIVTAGAGAAVANIAAILADTADMQPRVVAIEADTNELQTDDYPTSIAAVKTVADAIQAITDLLTLAAINAEVVDVINTDTSGEPAQGTPGATLGLRAKIDWLFKSWRNKKTQTSTQWNLYDDAGTTIDTKAAMSDVAGVTTKGELESGP